MKALYKSSILIVLLVMSVITTVNAQLKLQPLVGFGMQSMKYDFGNTDVKGSSGLNLGADLFYYLKENLAVGAGIRFSTYKTTATLDSYQITSSGTDADGDSYSLTKSLTGLDEKHTLSTIEIPVLARYERWFGPDIILFGTTGPVFIVPGASKTEIVSGKQSTAGYYAAWDLTVDDASEYNYGETSLAGTSMDNSAKFSLAWDIEVGAEYFLNKRMNLSLTAFYQPGLTSFLSGSDESTDSFNGSLVESGSAKLSKVGIRFGLSFDLTPPEKSSVKSIR